jgi:hypothetical protein
MDTVLQAAARALSAFDPLAALRWIALREDPDALALRGIAAAQLSDYATARKLLGRAARAFEATDPTARARCLAAQGEVALASRDLKAAGVALTAASAELTRLGDHENALFVQLQLIRRLVLLGEVRSATQAHRAIGLRGASPKLSALAHLVGADIALRSLNSRAARACLSRARKAASAAGIASLNDEIEVTERELSAPAARVVEAGTERLIGLDEVENILRSKAFLVDACRRLIRSGNAIVPLVTRPVLLALAVSLGSAAPGDTLRETLAATAFGARRLNESTRVRLRVEIGRLRRMLVDLASVDATSAGFALRPHDDARVLVLLPPTSSEASAVMSLLRAGESWSTSALAAAMGASQRTVQRALIALRDEERVEGIGRGRTQRWIARPKEGFATALLLVSRAPNG